MIPPMMTLVIATRNAHKTEEIRAVLGGSFRYLTLNDVPDAPVVQEDGDTFASNARKKAEVLAAWLTGFPELHGEGSVAVLADDSGLEVDALGGAPGVLSARYAAQAGAQTGNASDAANNAKLLQELGEVPAEERTARFRCVIALAAAGREVGNRPTRIFEGTCEGRILRAARGKAGFGYDPLFQPEGFTETFAELGESVKNRISHRAHALARLRDYLDSSV